MKLAGGIDFGALEDIAAPNFAGQDIGFVVGALIPYLFTFAGILLLLYLVLGGFQLMTSRGDSKAVEAGKSKIMYALIGFIIVFFAYWITQFVGLILGIDTLLTIFTGT